VNDDVVVEIKAAGINVDDVALLQDAAGGGWFFHGKTPTTSNPLIGGMEFAGVVVEVGPKCKRLKVGDKVLALQDIAFKKNPGCWAERTVSPEGHLIKFPSDVPLTFVEAASTAMAAMVSGDMYKRAYGASGEAKVKIAPTESRVVVVGASGGLGSVMVQLLAGRPEAERPHIIAVCSGSNAERMKRLGAHEVVDYKLGSFGTQVKEASVDIVFDFVGGGETEKGGRKVLRRNGKFITAVGPRQAIGDRVLTCGEWHSW
jgi:NADPH:quinone reductase-like Zn-dependent oxidoreductase